MFNIILKFESEFYRLNNFKNWKIAFMGRLMGNIMFINYIVYIPIFDYFKVLFNITKIATFIVF